MDGLLFPLHKRISNYLKQQIENQLLKPGSMLPSEKELCIQFTVSRITVRKSLSELQALGLIHSVPGKGTFVSYPHIKTPGHLFSSFTSDMERQSQKVGSLVQDSRIIIADSETAEKFRVSPGSEIVFVDRIRYLLPERTPVGIQKIMLLHNRCPYILQFNLEIESIYQILQNHYKLVFDRAETMITARMSTTEETRLLHLKKSSPLLQNIHSTYLTSGEIIEVADSVFRPDLYHLEYIVLGENTAIQD